MWTQGVILMSKEERAANHPPQRRVGINESEGFREANNLKNRKMHEKDENALWAEWSNASAGQMFRSSQTGNRLPKIWKQIMELVETHLTCYNHSMFYTGTKYIPHAHMQGAPYRDQDKKKNTDNIHSHQVTHL